MKRWEKLAQAELDERVDEFQDEIKSEIISRWKHFAETADCTNTACRFCPFDNIMPNVCDGEKDLKVIEMLNEEVTE